MVQITAETIPPSASIPLLEQLHSAMNHHLVLVSVVGLALAPTATSQSISTTPRVSTVGSGSSSSLATCPATIDDQSSPGSCINASTVPTSGMLLPLGPEFFVTPTGEVGIGTMSPITRLGVDGGALPGIFSSTDAIDVSAVTGWATATTGSGAFGLYGESDGDAGVGGLGWATDLTGATVGVSGEADSAAGTGVFGWASDTTGGANSGVFGESDSPVGTGVFGWASDLTGGFCSGVYGEADSPNGAGVLGWASSLTGTTVGVSGQTDSDQGTGVLGWATAATGTTSGVRGASNADSGAGVEGYATETAGANYGVYGETASPAGYGVFSGGDMGATGVKSFIQPHPADPGKEIRFVCLEGDESGTYFRGSGRIVDGRATIAVPEAFALVSEPQSLTVQLTPAGGRAVLWTEGESLATIAVRGDADVRFHYFVNGVRCGFAEFEPIRENRSFVPEVRGEQFGTQYPAELRRILVENGTLTADGTPDEGTAARQGWELRDAAATATHHPTPPVPDSKGVRTPQTR